MTTVNFLYQQAELAMAAYALLNEGETESQIANLIAQGFSQKQAEEFSAIYPEIVTQYNDTDTSFSATVFKDASGQLTLAIKGTQEFGDFVPTDDFIAGNGAGYDQIIAMYNWWQRVSSPAGQSVTQFRFTTSVAGAFIEEAPDIIATGELVDDISNDPDQKLNVTGHSLGAHLALAFNSLFSSITNEVTGFNTPGFINNSTNQQFFSLMEGEVPSTENSQNVTNVIADQSNIGEQPWNAVAELYFDENPIGDVINISIEDQFGLNSDEPFFQREPSRNHSQRILTDSLAVYNLLTKLSPSLSFDEYKDILNTSVIGTSGSYEGIIDSIEALFKINNTSLPTGNEYRNELYEAIYRLQNNSDFQLYSGQLQIIPLEADAAALKSNAETSKAYLYALIELTTFVVTGNDEIYTRHETNGLLSISNYSEEYITDRALFLSRKIQFTQQNISTLQNSSASTRFYDADSGLELTTNTSRGSREPQRQFIFGRDVAGESEFLIGGNGADHIYGGQGNDTIVGGEGEHEDDGVVTGDYLEGGEGNDTLYSNNFERVDDGQKDILKGGKGEDIYYVGDSDEIEDTDRTVQYIEFNAVNIGGDYVEVGPGEYENANNNNLKLSLSGDDAIISLAQGSSTKSFTIKNFKDPGQEFNDGDYGIQLLELPPPPPAEYSGTDLDEFIFVAENGVNLDRFEDLDEAAVDEVTFPAPVQKIRGMGGADTIQVDADTANILIYGDSEGDAPGLDGDDFIEVDRVNVFEGNAPVDYTQGATIYGEAGDDFIGGSQRNDFLHGQEDHDFIRGHDGADVIYGSTGNDFLEGGKNGNGMDQLLGGHGDDYVLGGAGTDLLVGGEGNDRLYGDADSQGFYRNEFGTFYDGETGQFTLFNDPLSGFQSALTEVAVEEAGDDYLEGGLGNDELYGGAGNDSLHGGENNDILQGEAGDDILNGGTGDDVLWGDKDLQSYIRDTQPTEYSIPTDTFIFRQHSDAADVTGNDILDGGAGTDKLRGGAGNDTYRFGFGYGKDFVLDEAGEADKVLLGAGITTANVDLKADDAGRNLIIKLKFDDGTLSGDELTISNWFGQYQVENIQFANGLIWAAAYVENVLGITGNPNPEVEPIVALITATENADVLPGTPDNDEIHLLGGNDLGFGGGGNDRLYGGTGNDELQGNNGNDLLQGDAGNDRLFGQLGNDQLYGGEGSDNLYGNEGNDILIGGEGADNLSGGIGNDAYRFNRGDGNDLILDDAGNDRIEFGNDIATSDIGIQQRGNDLVLHVLQNGLTTPDVITISDWFNSQNQIETISFSDGTTWDVPAIQALLPDDQVLADSETTSGSDNSSIFRFQPSSEITDGFSITVNDAGGIDQLLFERASLVVPGFSTFFATPILNSYSRDGNDLVLDVSVNSEIGTIDNSTGQVRITDYYTQSGFIETIEFPSGVLDEPNFAPTVTDSAIDQIILLDTPYTYQLGVNTFSDSELDILDIKATLADGTELPGWLAFDPDTLTFSGMPTSGDSEIIDVRVSATDSVNQSVSLDFNLNVGNVNLAPEVANPISDQVSRSQRAFSFQVPETSFSDINLNENLAYSAVLADGNELPAWLSFDELTGTFSGTPTDTDIGFIDVLVIATDSGGLTASDTFTLTTNEFNSIPVANPDNASVFFEPSAVTEPSEFLVNTETEDQQRRPSISKLSDGGFVSTWKTLVYDEVQDMTLTAIAGQRFDASGNKVGGEAILKQTSIDDFDYFDFEIDSAELSDGNFVVVWRDTNNTNAADSIGILGQVYDENLQPIGSEFVVSDSQNNEKDHKVVGLAGGGFVVTWSSEDENPINQFDYRVMAQRYDNSGAAQGAAITVSDDTDTSENQPDIAGTPDGGFIITWRDFSSNTIEGAAAQRFDANGNTVGAEFSVAISEALDYPYLPKITVLPDGSFVVIARDSDGFTIAADRFDSNANHIESFVITQQGVSEHEITTLSDGSFLVTWSSDGIQAARVDASGEISTFQVSDVISSQIRFPDVIELDGGELAVVWENASTAGDSNFGIVGKVFPVASASPIYLIDVLSNDSDADPDDDASNFTLDSVSLQGTLGSVTIENNQVRFDPGQDFNDLRAGDIATVLIDYTMSDNTGESASSTLTLNLRGSLSEEDADLSGVPRLINGDISINAAGDINNDGYADFVMADAIDNAGYVVFGSSDRLPDELRLREVLPDPRNPIGEPSDLDGVNGFRIITGEVLETGDIKSIDSAGDINGDGFDDLIVGAPFMSSSYYSSEGAAYVIYGNAGGFSSVVDTSALNGSSGFRIDGASYYGYLGDSVSSAGDVNGDGFDDLLITAPGEFNGYGATYIIFGQNTGFGASVDVNALDGSNGFSIIGAIDGNDGINIDNVGDFNGDGFDDILLSHISEDYESEAYIVFGKESGFSSEIELLNMQEEDGLRITGFGYNEEGLSLSKAGDLNGDGIDDVIIGDYSYYGGTGASYVVFGSTTGFGSTFDVENLDGSNGFVIYGNQEDDSSGFSVSGGGDINGDGFGDLLIGAPGVRNNGFYDVGASYVLFGDENGFDASFNLQSIDGDNGIRLLGLDAYHRGGTHVSFAGDVDGDGFDDVLVTSEEANYDGGESYLIYGKDYQNDIDILGTPGDDIINVTENDQNIFLVGGNDIVNIGEVENVKISTDRDTTIKFEAGGNTIRRATIRALGLSSTSVSIGSSSKPLTKDNGRYILLLPGYNGGSTGAYDIYTQEQVDPSSIRIGRGSLIIDILDGLIELHFEDVNTNTLSTVDTLFERITFNDTLTFTYQDILDLGFDFDGTTSNDELFGTEVTDRIHGYEGEDEIDGGKGDDELDGGADADYIEAGAGNDIIIGNTGDDDLYGGAGNDTYIINAGDGFDSIYDSSGQDKVFFGQDLSVSDLTVSQTLNDLTLDFSGQQSLTFIDWFGNTDSTIEQFIFSGDNLLTLNSQEIENLIQGNNINLAPGVNTGLQNQLINEDAPFSYSIPDDAFIDPDSANSLNYTATLSGGGDLPDWLTFDESTGTFNGVADNSDVGDYTVNVTATDNDGASISEIFKIIVNNTNDAPILQNPISDQSVDQDQPFSFTVPAETFSDDDLIHGDQLTFSASLSGDMVLPAWLTFDEATQSFSGTPADTDVGTYSVTVTATDNNAASISDTFSFTVNSTGASEPINGTNSSNVIDGTPGDDVIDGLGGHDTINGFAGNDVIIGGQGQDNLYGGEGDDTFIVEGTDNYFDRFNGGVGVDTVLGGDGDDTIRVNHFTGDDTVEHIDGGLGTNVLAGTNSSNTIDVSNTTLTNISAIDGEGGHDTITGNSDNNVIIGGQGQDNLYGGEGDDTFIVEGTDNYFDRFNGGAGVDTVLGGDGDDTIRVNHFTGDDTVEHIDGGLGTNVLAGTNSSNTIDVSNTTLTNISAIDGEGGHDTITGNSDNNVIIGGQGQDNLYGGEGDDTFIVEGTDNYFDRFNGGAGVDTVLGGDGDDTIRVNHFTGDDTVEHIDGGLGTNVLAGTNSSNTIDVSNTTLTNISAIDGEGGHDTITGNSDNNVIIGGQGQDNLYGGEGDDTFIVEGTDNYFDRFNGGVGVDTVLGGDGDDTIRVNHFTGDDTVEHIDGGLGTNVLAGTNSSNTIDVSNTTLTNISAIDGEGGHDTITGNSDNNVIIGGQGQDNLYGGEGDDTFIVEGTDNYFDRFNGGAGVDTVLGGDGDDTIRVNHFTGDDTVEHIDGGLGTNVLAGTNSSNTIDVSNTTLTNISAIDGEGGHDTITGNSDNNVIIGGQGQDNLYGGEGDDTFIVEGTDNYFDRFNGGVGVDTVLGGDGDDTIRVNHFTGDDTVEHIDGGLGTNVLAGTNSSNTIDVSNTTLTNISAIDGEGGHDTITGNSDNNVIIGGQGQDNLYGGDGNDTYIFNLGDSIDTLFDSSGQNDNVSLNGIANDELWFWQSGNDLNIGILDTTDKITIQNWYGDTNNRIESFTAIDSSQVLLESNVQQLVDAMAAFSAPNSGTLSVPQEVQDDVQAVIATTWQAA